MVSLLVILDVDIVQMCISAANVHIVGGKYSFLASQWRIGGGIGLEYLSLFAKCGSITLA